MVPSRFDFHRNTKQIQRLQNLNTQICLPKKNTLQSEQQLFCYQSFQHFRQLFCDMLIGRKVKVHEKHSTSTKCCLFHDQCCLFTRNTMAFLSIYNQTWKIVEINQFLRFYLITGTIHFIPNSIPPSSPYTILTYCSMINYFLLMSLSKYYLLLSTP